MRKLLLLFALFSVVQIAMAQLTGGIKLNEQRIGSAGNLLTVDEFNCNQIDVSDSLIIFIHRNDVTNASGTNIGQYRFDKSEDGGKTWTPNIGPFTANPPDNDYNINGRYPQGLIYNPAGNTVYDSAWLIYSGTWHNEAPGSSNGSWVGQLRGRGKISGDTSTFSIHADTINNGVTDIGTSMIQSSPGVFWVVNEDFTGTFASGSNQITNGVILEKGVWDSTSQEVIWTTQELTQTFDSSLSGASPNYYYSVARAFNIAFDPSGQYGWVSCLGDITVSAAGDSVFNPIFWSSSDGGNTWSQAFELKLDSLPGVLAALPQTNTADDQLTGVPTTLVEAELTVDYLGNPHLFTTVTDGGGYGDAWGYFPNAGYLAYDITYNAHAQPCDSNWQGWSAIFIDSIQTLTGSYIFFFWLDSDLSFLESEGQTGDANNAPNLFARAFDVAGYTSTPVFNITGTDSLFAGSSTTNNNGGQFLIGANFPVISPTANQISPSLYNIPLVLTEIDYINQTGTPSLGSGANPAAFWYINNLTFSTGDFSNSILATVNVLGSNPDTVPVGNNYVDGGASITFGDTSCHPTGFLFIVTDTAYVNTSTTGTYYVYYNAEDSDGTVFATGVRTVLVVGPPVAYFTYYATGGGLTVNFTDASSNSPNAWAWTFGDGTTSNNPDPVHVYADTGTYNVCLTTSNPYGSSVQYCQSIQVNKSGVGITPIDFSDKVNLYPNPTNGDVLVQISTGISSDFTVSVYDLLGQQVMGTMEEKAGTNNVQLNLASLSGGTYMVKLRSANGTAVKEVVLAHTN
jgi:hypothetical protein